MDKKNEKKKTSLFGSSFNSKSFRSGAYATLISALVIAAVLVLNLIVSTLDVRKDLTADAKYSLTKTTEEMLDKVEDKLTFYFLTKDGATVEWFDTFFEQYQKKCKNIDFKTIDLILNPKFAEQYTDEAVMQYSLIVVNERTQKSKYVAYEDMLLMEMTLDESTFQFVENVVGLDVEGQINAAIQYVTSENQTNFYAVTGHGELLLGETGQNLLRKSNVNYDTFEIMTAAAVPEDCDILYISVPSIDYTESELALLESYLASGGDFIITAMYQENMPNFNKLLARFGVEVAAGVILEGDADHYLPNYPYAIFPVITVEHEISRKLTGSSYLPILSATALNKMEGNSALTFSTLLKTTDQAYLKKTSGGYITSVSKEKGDAEGPFPVGLFVENGDTGSQAVIISSGSVFTDDYLSVASYQNSQLLTGSVNFMADAEVIVPVRTISFDTKETLTVTASESIRMAIIFAAVIPAVLVLVGVVIMVRRRKR